MSDAVLFRKCLGLNDARAFGTQILVTSPRAEKAGDAEFTDCLNLTTTDDGAVEKIPSFSTVITHSAPVTSLSAGYDRFVYQDGTDTKEWDGTNIATIGAVLTGPIVHTPIDVRLSTATKIYKSIIAGAAMTEATLGDLSNLPDRDKISYAKQPPYTQAFAYNGHLYGVNPTDPRMLQWSMWVHFDAWRLADDFMQAYTSPIIQAGAIPGVVITTHEAGVTVYTGASQNSGFTKRFYPCVPYANTLFSGQVSKLIGYMHILMAADGIYAVTPDGAFTRITESLSSPNAVNSSYTCATVSAGKYLAFGNAVCFEYDFKTKAILKRSPLGVASAAIFKDTTYFATGGTIVKSSGLIDASSTIQCSLTLPFSDLSAPGTKVVDSLYFTGTMSGVMTITATDQSGASWTREVSDELLAVSNYRIKTPHGRLGNHISFKIDCTSGAFRLEELRAVLVGTKRSR